MNLHSGAGSPREIAPNSLYTYKSGSGTTHPFVMLEYLVKIKNGTTLLMSDWDQLFVQFNKTAGVWVDIWLENFVKS